MDETTQPAPQPAATPPGSPPTGRPRRKRRIVGWLVALATIIAIVGALAWVVSWSRSRTPSRATPTSAEATDARQGAWTSAMEKAGVEAEYPDEPVDLSALKPTGREPFSATFTAEELDALVAVYRYTPDDPAAAGAEITDLAIEFPAPGRASILTHLVADNTRYEVAAAADTTYEDGRVVIAEDGAELRVEGFGVGGAQKQQAFALIDRYANGLLDTAPGLEITTAEITGEGVAVTGFAPTRIENP